VRERKGLGDKGILVFSLVEFNQLAVSICVGPTAQEAENISG
jgi:hypothetical protein